MPKSRKMLTSGEKSRMAAPNLALPWAPSHNDKTELYRMIVRELLGSTKVRLFLEGRERIGALQTKIDHIVERYWDAAAALDAGAYKTVIAHAYQACFDSALPAGLVESALTRASVARHPVHRMSDLAGRASARAIGASVASVGASGGKTVAELAEILSAAAATGVGGGLTLLTTGREIRIAFRAADRVTVARTYAREYSLPEDEETPLLAADFSARVLSEEDLLLGEIATYAANKNLAHVRRSSERIVGGVIAMVGGALTLSGVGVPIGVPIGAAGVALSFSATTEELGKAAYKARHLTRGEHRRAMAKCLWYLGTVHSGHPRHEASIEFMRGMGILDDGEALIDLGFFDIRNKDLAIEYIMRKLRSS